MASSETDTPLLPPQPYLVDAHGVAAELSIGVRTLWRWVSVGIFPPPDVRIGSKVVRWKWETVTAWVDAQHGQTTASMQKQEERK